MSTTATTPSGTQTLAYTGTTADTGMLIGFGLLLVVGGGLMLLVRRTPSPRK
ncbi:LPXTG cell wall anchor domain-containing protein [Kutzneria sp. CA-103260]|uniref:LPXTG cell wall anchor domain-containing protein n=1 Tax=Kutzneria sp. CA-103260 TaxID=2802641 RepID=UPI001BA7CD4D|nr:LPXTG cell wall anchor domain-containing protein [Kutzneria sp. CA-103260]